LATMTLSGYTVTVTDGSTDDAALPAASVTVNWGDGTLTTGSPGSSFSHTYSSSAIFTITHTVRDAGGLFGSGKINVEVPGRVSISGTVRDNKGAPLPNVDVLLKENGITRQVVSTDGNGVYGFSSSAGAYLIQVYLYGAAFLGNPAIVNLTAGTPLVQDFIQVQTHFTLTVHTSPALPGAAMTVKENGITRGIVITDIAGDAAFPNLPSGTYSVEAFKPAYTFGPVNPVRVTLGPSDAAVTFADTR